MSARVFVPLVGANGEAAQVFEAIAGDIAPDAHPARLLPQISELFDFGLYGVGQIVREAVARFVDARRARLWLGRRNGRTNSWNLRISDLQVGRLSDENARSAGLGLALAAILQAFGRDPGIVFATGEIRLPSGPGEPAVAVAPVDALRSKLLLVGDYVVQHRQALDGEKLTVVLPALTPDGRATELAEGAMLARLKREAADAGAQLTFVFADTLDGVEDALGPFSLREIVTPARALWLGLAAAFIVAFVTGWVALRNAPIELAWAPLANAGPDAAPSPGASDATPQRARYDSATDKFQLLGECFNEQREPLVLGGESLLLRVSARDGLPFASRLRPPRIFIASVSRAADPVILDANQFRSLIPQSRSNDLLDLTMAVPVEATEDEVRLFVVATRDPTIAITILQDELRKRLQGLSGAAVLTTTTSFLADQLGAEIQYQFKVTNDRQLCPT
ncbi:MAG TPA: hypothetical protein VEK35_08415 [Roseiarcus sp.]|nr:hypothetical protein [Roseiarcus sp.]